LLSTEIKAWRHDPITALGGFIPPVFILLAFGLLFGGRLTFKIAVINKDRGLYGAQLRQMFDEVISPFDQPYYDAIDMPENETWAAYRSFRLDGIWLIPADFSQRIAAGDSPTIEMYFSNYNDDRAKNHRIYAAEILWAFYERIGQPLPPLALAEEYPLPEMVDWFPIIAIGVALLSFMLGGMMNIFMLTHKENLSGVTLEFGLAPRSLGWVLAPKLILSLVMGLLTGTAFLLVVFLWTGAWPGWRLWAFWILAGLVILFWSPLTMLLAFRARYFAGAIAVILTGLTAFFIGGGLGLIRGNERYVPWFSWLFPNTYAVDPLRDLALFHSWPVDWWPVLAKLAGFAALSLAVCLTLAVRRLRNVG
jgi:hypothetical protein